MFCNNCGQENPQNSKFCHSCGNQIQGSGAGTTSANMPKIEDVQFAEKKLPDKEKIYYSDGNNVIITQTRFTANGTSYVLKKIESVTFKTIKKSRKRSIIFLIAGIPLAFITMGIGIILSVIGLIWLLRTKDSYSVKIDTDSNSVDSIKSFDGAYIQKIVNALNEAIMDAQR